jgi:hypothetical protein
LRISKDGLELRETRSRSAESEAGALTMMATNGLEAGGISTDHDPAHEAGMKIQQADEDETNMRKMSLAESGTETLIETETDIMLIGTNVEMVGGETWTVMMTNILDVHLRLRLTTSRFFLRFMME